VATVDAMLTRLPQLYRDGELVRDVLELAAVQIEVLGEEAVDVQRAHWFDQTLDLSEAARLGALLDISPEPWQELDTYRAWLHGLVEARLRFGSVTLHAMQEFVADYSTRLQQAVRVPQLLAIPSIPPPLWEAPGQPSAPAFIENPPERRYQRAPATGGIEPLHQFTIVNRGLDETQVAFLLVGLPSAPETVPVIANLTTGEGLIYMGNIPVGARLWIRPDPSGAVTAWLEGEDVSARMRSVSGLTPGTPWPTASVQQPARSITLRRGENAFWFLPVAHFDALGLDRFLLALADLLLQQGRFDETQFDRALFYQDPAINLYATWIETPPATFEIRLPGGALLSNPDELDDALHERDLLGASLNQAIHKLKAAGIGASVQLQPFREIQGQMDRLTQVLPLTFRELGPTGADQLPDAGGVFEITAFDDSTFR